MATINSSIDLAYLLQDLAARLIPWPVETQKSLSKRAPVANMGFT